MTRAYHGTGEQAIEWVLNVNKDQQHDTFLKSWQEGDAEACWPEFYEWLDQQPQPAATFEEALAGMVKLGYQYGADALENVRLGWDMAQEQPTKVADGTGDAAIAIGEHAFRAGYEAGNRHAAGAGHPETNDPNTAWPDYDPPEHIKELS